MALVVKDRVKETTSSTGTGTITLAGAVSGFQSFSVIGNGNTTYYTITDGTNWEVGIGTYTSVGTTLSRDTILESSNGGTAVNFGAGTKDVFVTYPAEKSISDGYGLLSVANGGTGVTTSTGTGSVVLSTSPTLTTPNLGTPSAATLTNATGLPIVAGTTGTLSVARGGTGQTSYTNGQLLIGNTTGNTLTPATLTAGSNISITNGAGSITIASTDQFTGTVTSVALSGGTTGLTVSGSPITTSGTITLGGTLAVANGGTGATSLTSGYLVKGNGTSAATASVVYDNGTNVGIGTSSPGELLQVNTASTSTAGYIETSSGNLERLRIGYGYSVPQKAVDNAAEISSDGTGNLNYSSRGNVTNAGHRWYTSSDGLTFTARMCVTSSGNVGIGTSSPSGKLDVSNGGTTALFGADSGADTRTDATSKLARIGVPHYTNAEEPVAMFVPVTGSATNQLQIGGGTGSFNAMNLIQFYTAANNTTLTGTERMRIDSSGNVGIGTTSPSQKLHVNSGRGQISISSSGATASAQGNALFVEAGFDTGITIGTPNTGTGALYFADAGSSTIGFVRYLHASDAIALGTNAAERLRIDSSGNVGIGTTTPSAKLDVSGTVNFTGALTSGDLADAVGYKGLPQNAKTAAYTLALSDMGKHISITTGGITVPANASVAFPIGATIVIFNNSASSQNIAITTDTMYLAGTATTGTRTLAQRGLATVVKVASTTWVISGSGVT